MNFKLLLILAGCSTLFACASADKMTGRGPIVDMKGVDPDAYSVDLGDCQVYADEVQVVQQTAAGAVTGAATGAVIGAAVGNSQSAQRGAGVGAATGALAGGSRGMNERQRVVKNCLRGRGYYVLN